MLQIGFMQTDLASLDELNVHVLVLPLFQGERVLRGTASFCDWRLNGRISRLIQDGFVTGTEHEAVLLDTCHRIGCERILLVHHGFRNQINEERFLSEREWLLNVIGKARFESFGIDAMVYQSKHLELSKIVSIFLSGLSTIKGMKKMIFFEEGTLISSLVADEIKTYPTLILNPPNLPVPQRNPLGNPPLPSLAHR